MSDRLDQITRSRVMSAIRGKDTKPEMIIRRGLHARGFRYRLHDSRLPGRPDIFFPQFDSVLEIRGCFWHLHGCNYFRWPRTRPKFWYEKLTSNVQRDERNILALENLGLRVLVIWECSLRDRSDNEVLDVINKAAHWINNGSRSENLGKRRITPPLPT